MVASGSALSVVRMGLRGKRFLDDILGKTATVRARRRCVINAKMDAVKVARAEYRQAHVRASGSASVIA